MDLHGTMFETAVDSPVDAGADTPADVAADVTPAETVETPAAAPAFDQQALGEQIGATIDQRLAPLVDALTPRPEPQTFELDPFSDNYQQQLEQMIDARAQQMIAPYQQAAEYMQQQQASAWVDQNLDQAMVGYKAPDGADGDRQAVLYAAAGFRAVTGDDSRAIVAARDYMVEHDRKVGESYVEAYKQSISGNGTGGSHSGPGVAGAAVTIEPKATSYDEVLARWEGLSAA